MPALHLVGNAAALRRCLSRAGEGEAVLLLGETWLTEAGIVGEGHRCVMYVLASETSRESGDAGATVVDYAGFVALTESHRPVVPWF
jgi:hypothetical protein